MTREIQTGFYGRPLDSFKPSDHPFQESFVYPLYVVFLLTPTLNLRFQTVQEIFRWLLLFVTACCVPLWMYAIGFRVRLLVTVTGIILVLSSYPAVVEFYMQNLAALALFFLAAGAAAATRNWLMLSGFMLALATIRPDISGLLVLWFLLWSASQWREKKLLIFSFAGSMASLITLANVVSPGWIVKFLTAVREYPAYGADPSIVHLFLPSFLAKLVTATLLCVLIALCWHWRQASPGSSSFASALAWVSVVTIAILPKLAGYNQPLLIPALLVLLARRDAIWNAGFVPRFLVKVTFACQLWQWTVAPLLSACSLFVSPAHLRPAALAPVYTMFSLSAFTLIAVIAVTFSQWRVRHEPGQSLQVVAAEIHPHKV